jgi:hypothetical protein
LYVKDGDRIADVTFGSGTFWKKTDLSKLHLSASDISTCPCAPYDFRQLPYENESYNHMVLDPPYMHNAGKPMVDKRYGNSKTTKGMYHRDIMNIYFQGMTEGFRILKVGGLLWVKCQDEIESGYQRWSHIEIHDFARTLEMYGKDLFVLIPTSRTVVQRKQQHARKTHSYLWLFAKPTDSQRKALIRHGILNDPACNSVAIAIEKLTKING